MSFTLASAGRFAVLAIVITSVWAVAGGGALAQAPGSSLESAVDVGVPSTTAGSLDAEGESDFFRFPATAGEPLQIAVALGSLGDSILEIFSTDGTTSLAFNDDFESLASQIRFNPPETADFIAVVGGFGGAAGSYTLIIEVAPEITLGAGPRFVDGGVSILGETPVTGSPPQPSATSTATASATSASARRAHSRATGSPPPCRGRSRATASSCSATLTPPCPDCRDPSAASPSRPVTSTTMASTTSSSPQTSAWKSCWEAKASSSAISSC